MADSPTHTIVKTIRNHEGGVEVVVPTPDNRFIISGGRKHDDNNTIIKSDRRTGQAVKRRENAHNDNDHDDFWGDEVVDDEIDIRSLVTDGSMIVSCAFGDSTVKVWNMDLELEHSLEGHDEDGVLSVAISPDSTTIAAGAHYGEVKIWNKGEGGRWLCTKTLNNHTSYVNAVVFSPNARYGW